MARALARRARAGLVYLKKPYLKKNKKEKKKISPLTSCSRSLSLSRSLLSIAFENSRALGSNMAAKESLVDRGTDCCGASLSCAHV